MSDKDYILYVDDEQDNLSVFTSVFRRDYNIITCNSPKEGLDILEKEVIKVVISDQRMPEMTGLEFFKITSERFPSAIRIILTAYTDTDVIIDAINNGNIYRFITKPWKKEEVHSAIKGAIQLYNLQLENKNLLIDLQNSVVHLEDTVQTRTKHLLTEITNKNKVTSVLAHDIKNSFNTIILATDYLKKNFDNTEADKIVTYITDMNDLALQSSELLETILEWSVTGDRSDIEPVELDLHSIIDSNISFLKAFAKQKNITIEANISEDHKVFCDKNMINVIIRNITGNAIKYTPDKGKISINSEIISKNIEITIRDTGVGMDEDSLKNLFESDYTFTKLGTKGEKGTGLGLVICKDFAEKNKGEIRVSSELGKGSSFTIKLPMKKA